MPCEQEFASTCAFKVIIVEITFRGNEEFNAWVGPCTSLIFGYGGLYVIFSYIKFDV